jgi:hypothetical protein
VRNCNTLERNTVRHVTRRQLGGGGGDGSKVIRKDERIGQRRVRRDTHGLCPPESAKICPTLHRKKKTGWEAVKRKGENGCVLCVQAHVHSLSMPMAMPCPYLRPFPCQLSCLCLCPCKCLNMFMFMFMFLLMQCSFSFSCSCTGAVH